MRRLLTYSVNNMLPRKAMNHVIRTYAKRNLVNASHVRKAIGKIDTIWRARIDDVVSSPDNLFIHRDLEAGAVKDYYITMHNGVKVCANGYYGSGILNMLIENRGVHEPQEERAFEEIINLLPESCTMLELGAYWGFYSLSLLQARPQAKCHLVEPEIYNITSGQINFELNSRKGNFLNAKVDEHQSEKLNTISVDSYCESNSIKHLNILHSDIQGFEFSMLKGADRMLSKNCVDYLFISTHSNELHEACTLQLLKKDYCILASANLDETFSCDGLIVAKRPSLKDPSALVISKKRKLAAAG